MVVSEPKNSGSPPNKGHPLVPTQPQEWTEIPDLCHPSTPDQAVKFIYNDVTSRFWGEWCRGPTIGYRVKLIGIGTRDQSLHLGFFGVSCLMACDILVK